MDAGHLNIPNALVYFDNCNNPYFSIRRLATPRALLKGTSAVVKKDESTAHSLPPLR